jgi:hypothetical protein
MSREGLPGCGDVRDELSAWLDGRSDDPGGVEAHLAACADCAKHCRELKTLSDALKAMPGPAVGDEFALRVAARIRPAARTARGSKYWAAASALLATAASIAIVAAVLMSLRASPPISSTRGEDAGPVRDAGMVAEILLGGDTPGWDFGFPVPEDGPETDSDDLVLALSSSGWFEDAAQEWEAAQGWETDADIDDLIDALDETQRTEFKRLLRTYREGAQI